MSDRNRNAFARMPRWGWACLAMACCALLLGACHGGRKKVKQGGGDPEPQGIIWDWDLPKGLRYGFKEAPGGPDSVDFIGRVYCAAKDTLGTPMDTAKHPLVIVAHGKVLLGVPNNYKGMSYLTRHLASWGDIVMSVNLDVVTLLQGQSVKDGIPHRGELVLHAIEYMVAQARDPLSPFYQRIDTNRIALVGHSRGGGAVVYAANANGRGARRPIKAIATLSPANFGTAPLQVPVPHICLYGTWDGDLCRGEGPDLWARGTRQAPRELVEIYGANHYFFTDKISFPGDTNEIDRKAHHLIANGMVNAWFEQYLRPQRRYDWMPYLGGTIRLGEGLEYYTSFQDARFLPIYNAGAPPALPGPELGDSTENGPQPAPILMTSQANCKVSPLGLCAFDFVQMQAAPDYCPGSALMASWDERKDRLSLRFAPTNAAAYGYLSFRASQIHGDSLNRLDQRKDFEVVMCDEAGKCVGVSARDYLGGLQYPDLSRSLPADDPDNRKQIMRGFRIPVAHFRAIDLVKVTQIDFVFNRPSARGFDNRSGSIKVTDVEFSH